MGLTVALACFRYPWMSVVRLVVWLLRNARYRPRVRSRVSLSACPVYSENPCRRYTSKSTCCLNIQRLVRESRISDPSPSCDSSHVFITQHSIRTIQPRYDLFKVWRRLLLSVTFPNTVIRCFRLENTTVFIFLWRRVLACLSFQIMYEGSNKHRYATSCEVSFQSLRGSFESLQLKNAQVYAR